MDPVTLAALAAVLGPVVGSTMGGLSTYFQKPGKWNQLDIMTPEQRKRAEFAGNFGQNLINNPYEGFEPIQRNAMNQFNQQIIPGLSERFASLGDNALSSGAFQSQLGQAGSGLAERLAAMQSQYGQQQQGLGRSLLGIGQAPQFENYYQQPEQTFLSGLLGGQAKFANTLGNLGGQYAMYGGGMGGMGGGSGFINPNMGMKNYGKTMDFWSNYKPFQDFYNF